jgi:hypothetical protein
MVRMPSFTVKNHATQNPSRVVHEEFIQSWVLCTRTPLAVSGVSRRAKTILQSCNTKEYCDEEEVCLSTQRGIMDTIHASPATALQVDNWTSQPRLQSPYFKTFMGPRNRFQGMNSASLCSLAGRYDNPIPTRFLVPIDCLKIRAQCLSVWGLLPSLGFCLGWSSNFVGSESGQIQSDS